MKSSFQVLVAGGKRQFFDEIPGLLQLCGVVVLVPLRSDALFADGFRIAPIVTRVGWRRDGLLEGEFCETVRVVSRISMAYNTPLIRAYH